ncbi:glycosyl hydrolase family 18 protein [Gracilibacillus caseinilyticus]|uniref:chitinase n=1 Tax=Gracilibacillus caseinilyticus TaxID=2932256 RepID=A0ABY4ESL2_9BACI|nr:glycosyl hydrolase family 18 protein [Gracilibacillus caseinilyticus]UOQ46727.1 glycosyl hydrolase family 18 protein [Gracilibacillus caseinilyticus]
MSVRKNLPKGVKCWVFGAIGLLFFSIGLSLVTTVQTSAAEQDDEYRVVGYYTQWSTYGRDYQAVDIDASNLTHIVYAFADYCWEGAGNAANTQCEGIENGTVVSADPWADYQNKNVLGLEEGEEWNRDFHGNLGGLAKLKDENPGLKTLLSVGGWTFSKNFSNVAASEETRQRFAASAVEFMRTYEMDGVDIDWEYPVEGGLEGNVHRPEDKENHTLLLQAIRDELDKAEQEDGKQYELAIASSANPSYLEHNELDKIAEIVDFIDIMTYDFNGSWQKTSAHNAPLFADPQAKEAEVPSTEVFNVATAIQGHLDAGVPSDKLVMGMPFYGRSWGGCDADRDTHNGGYYQNCEGAGNGTWEAGVYDYDDIIKHKLTDNQYTAHWNDAAKVPYLYNEQTGEFISYDDKRSIAAKVAYVENLELGGAMIWELSADRESQLLGLIKNEFSNGTVPPAPTPPDDGTINSMDDLEINGEEYKYTNLEDKESVEFQASLIEEMPANAKLTIMYKDLVMSVPVSVLKTGQNITIQFGPVEGKIKDKQDHLISSLYDLQLLSGEDSITDFGENSVTLTFEVDAEQVDNWDELALYLLDETGKKTKENPVKYDKENATVSSEVAHFSIYGVFQNITEEDTTDGNENESGSDNDNDERDSPEENTDTEEEPTEAPDENANSADKVKEEKSEQGNQESPKQPDTNLENEEEGQYLPNTATNQYKFLLAGLLLVIAGGSVQFISPLRKR